MHSACAEARRAGKRLGFVPTMGALHEGHLSLIRAARAHCDVVAASVFVNPTQFGPNEDFSKYPRTLERDKELLAAENTDILFVPSTEEMYPPGASTFVDVEGVSDRLDGKSRPGHFRGVTTIVSKLFHIVQPGAAFFGQKDAAQVAIIRKMVRDQNFPVEIVACPIVREADGLAMSSRNAYLDEEARQRAVALSAALRTAEVVTRDKGLAAGLDAARAELRSAGIEPEYLEARDAESLEPVVSFNGRPVLVALAAPLGRARLIDNVLIQPKPTAGG